MPVCKALAISHVGVEVWMLTQHVISAPISVAVAYDILHEELIQIFFALSR